MYSEETASPGLWKSEIVALMGVALIATGALAPPGTDVVYANWLIGLIAANTAIAFAGNRKWERPIAGGAAIWLFISGFVPSLVSGPWMRAHEIAIGIVLLLSAVSAHRHLRDDIRHARPLTM
jgi:hypothetical protein